MRYVRQKINFFPPIDVRSRKNMQWSVSLAAWLIRLIEARVMAGPCFNPTVEIL